jgi:hypothetical protein
MAARKEWMQVDFTKANAQIKRFNDDGFPGLDTVLSAIQKHANAAGVAAGVLERWRDPRRLLPRLWTCSPGTPNLNEGTCMTQPWR